MEIGYSMCMTDVSVQSSIKQPEFIGFCILCSADPASDPPKMIPPKVVAPPPFPSSVSSDCQFRLNYTGGNSVSAFRGTFASVNFPEHYPDNRECAWIIEVPQGFSVFILFKNVDLDRYASGLAVLKL